ncbi:MAG: FKBP-type peptidyl-prolyl cis-trans isomerase [Burkholderiaceae bacterium]|nr:FKBP-type peptidyl-prolyl cis-trans isomerase [Sulfuritalea sp.]MCF8174677.1 FKBP-type peptidyl-prolyl cis-trans isomerase [Burkholderiaceae bacterium]MCF8184788.1 FKBP-type peptidyl-prolyl cis-trans isomerase [Polynucleobacter sp.]
MSETVHAGNLITLHYRVATADDTELVSTFGSTPATLQLGNGELAPPLEHCLIGITVGERHVFLLEAEQAFGSHNPQLTQRMPRSDLPPASSPELHGLIEFSAPSGDKFTGIVRELDDEAVLVDFNHPLAGKSVRFEVEIIGIL